MAGTAALAAAWGLTVDRLGPALAAPIRGADSFTTRLRTIRMSTNPIRGSYRTLVSAPGEEFIPRLDLTGKGVTAGRAGTRRSLYYLAHLSDIHIIDAQTPARMDAIQSLAPKLFTDACRPQDTLTAHVLASVVASVRANASSEVTGAPLSVALSTGDSADNLSHLETRWYIDLLDGGEVLPNSGAARRYEGPQVWEEATYAYHPEDPAGDVYGDYGFPAIPGMLAAAVSEPVTSPGLPVPWYAVYGNHDSTFMGTFHPSPGLYPWALGSRKASLGGALGATALAQYTAGTSAASMAIGAIRQQLGLLPGIRTVTPDPARKLLERTDFMKAHLDSPAVPGPVGHGWTSANVESGETWWSAQLTPYLRAFGLDTCNQVAGADGAVPMDQADWLRDQLQRCQDEGVLAIVCSHHNSLTLENQAAPVTGDQPLINGEQFISLLLEFPACVVWLNGHTHTNTIRSHPGPSGGGFWEITTASCIDFPQQQQLVELVDNRDGTMSIFVTALDHAADPVWSPGDFSQLGLASLSRELSANAFLANPALLAGSPLDRNVELLLRAPFDLAAISDATVEAVHMASRARLIAAGIE